MEELDLLLIKQKAKKGVLALTSRTFILHLIAYGSTFLLTIILDTKIFGIFIVVTAAVSFLRYFSVIGLAAALVQKKEAVSEDDLKTTFTIQTGLILIFVLIALYLADFVSSLYKLDSAGVLLYKSLLFSFLLSSFKTMPSILLERKLDFDKFVIPEIVENLFFYLTVILFAWLGYGISSFTIGVLVRSISGVITIYLIAPWIPKIGFSKNSAKNLIKFGLPFQVNSLLALVKDDLLTLYLGTVIGFQGVGFIGWAKKWAEVPLRLIMDNINKVSFPAFSRLQHNKEELSKSYEKTLFYVLLFTIPIVLVGMVLIEPVVSIIPRYAKWMPAILSFYFFSLSVIFSSVSSMTVNVIQAVGKVKVILKLMVMWTLATWALIPLFVNYFGFNGVSIAMFIISLTGIIPILILTRILKVNISRSILRPLVIGLITLLSIFFMRLLFPIPSFLNIFIIAFSGFITYFLMLIILAKKEIRSIVKL